MTHRHNIRNDGQQLTTASLDIEELLDDPAASHWLKQSLTAALTRDPVDAFNDAVVLAEALRMNLQSVLRLEYPLDEEPGRGPKFGVRRAPS
jgi:hypothetical protein